jgi:tRNA pseudouridine32 synthase/23S rRNA pseudouridine746 synthase
MAPERLDIVHATDRYVVVNKPAGLLSVPGKGQENQDCVPARVRKMFPKATGPLVVHRLDMDTSGLLVIALDADSQRELSGQFERREVEKQYVALVDGIVAVESGTIDVPIRPDPFNRPYQVVDRSHGRPAVTCWKVLAYETDRTRVELIPLTGRTHQLRVHCAYAGPGGMASARGNGLAREKGHPILGDVLYGPQPETARLADRLLLHASAVTFTDPKTGRRVAVESRTPF